MALPMPSPSEHRLALPVPGLDGWTVDQIPAIAAVVPFPFELIGGQIVMMAPARVWHNKVKSALEAALESRAPDAYVVLAEQGVVTSEFTDPVPDVLVIDAAAYDENAHSFPADAVVLAIEIVSPGNAAKDRHQRPLLYAEAKVPFFWRVENEDGSPAIFAYRLGNDDGYDIEAVFRRGQKVELSDPFEISFAIAEITPRRKSRSQ